jgi:long-chain fatty acid transport protein
VELDFSAPTEFSGLAPGLSTALGNRGLLDAPLDVGIKVPQQGMGSVFSQLNDRWAVLGSIGWQQWSKFGQVQLGIDDTSNPTSTTTDLDFKDTWHFAAGAQHRRSEPWLLNFGIAYDTGYPVGRRLAAAAYERRLAFRRGGEQQLSKTASWGIAAECL